jgi:glucose-1-phosphatase
MQKIENIIFDLGGVLLNIDYNLTRQAFERAGVSHFDEMYSQSNADELFKRLETGKITPAAFYIELNKCTGLDMTPMEIDTAWNAMLLTFRESSLLFLKEISKKYQLFLLSNTNFIHIDAFQKIYHSAPREISFEEHFRKVFYSCEIGLRKPDQACYDFVLNDLKIDPAKTLFIDDSSQNILAADTAGLQTVLLKDGELIENLGL